MINNFSLTYTIRSFFTKGHKRTLRAKKNVVISFICKGISILISFWIVPLTLGYVGKVEYGIWMTISAIIHWFHFFDIGLGNGLRNKVAEAIANNNTELARTYISSAFAIISGISIILFIGFYVAAHYISWNAALNTSVVSNDELLSVVVMVFFFFCVGFILGLVSSILQATQRYAINDILGLLSQILGFSGIYFLVKNTDGSLFYLCLIYGSKSAVVLFFASIALFMGPLSSIRPGIEYINFKKVTPLVNLGIRFFISQIFYLIVTQSSVILVVQFFGPADVTTFNLAVRYMTIISMAYMMVLSPFLSAFTEAYTKKEYDWIKGIIKRINTLWLTATLATIILVLINKTFFKFWVGDAVTIPLSLIVALAFSSILNTWGATYSLFLNGIGKVKMQLFVVGLQALLFIPLSYLLYRLHFGLVSIVAVQVIFYSASALLMTMQYKKIINQRATGIWYK